jgi:pilus assembly protein Flp/PilA
VPSGRPAVIVLGQVHLRSHLTDPGEEVKLNMTRRTLRRLQALVRPDESGQGLAEYALILGLIAIVAIVALIFLGSQISDKLSIVGNAV